MAGLELFFKDDILNILTSLHQATLQSGAEGEYRRGYEAALLSMALAFGLDPRHSHALKLTERRIPSNE